MASGARVAFGSDWFVAPPDPLLTIHAAVTRATLDGAKPGGWVPEERVGVDDALRAHTREGAFASFEDDRKGTIARGMLADLTVIDADLTRIAPERIPDARVLLTIVGGKRVFDAGSLGDAADLQSAETPVV